MTDASLTPREVDDALAAEYVLGVLDLAERGAAQARIKREPEFAALVTAWENRLAGMNEAYAEAPAPNLMPLIEARLFPTPGRDTQSKGLFSGWLGWVSGASVAALLVLAIIAFVAPPRSMLIATLAAADNRLAYEVSQFGSAIKVSRVEGQGAGPGLVHELWLIAPGKSPVSLGLLDDAPLIIDQPVPPAGWTLAVSLEPAGGSPSGLPTGPVILSAEIGA
jgi:anti-sigma-K factor RskA